MKIRVHASELYPVYGELRAAPETYGTWIEIPEAFWRQYTETREKFEDMLDRLEAIVDVYAKEKP